MLDQKIRGTWNKALAPVGRGLGRLGLTPNAVTVLGVAIQVLVAVEIVRGRLFAAGLIGFVGAMFDGFDGAVARAQGKVSKFGALLDSTTDRLTETLYLLPLAWLYGVAPDVAERDEPWVAGAAMTALVFGFLVSYVKARAEGLGFECRVGVAERAERMILLILGLLLDLVPVAIVVLAVASAITFLQRLLHVRKQSATVA
ncbi:MAG: CDP-alcohol phosphatidyltransferase family protein [Actinomycetota bacterium]|nr:CDP-alcohol phosphatidyltransferase family protein [Actinomycetota bacterium]